MLLAGVLLLFWQPAGKESCYFRSDPKGHVEVRGRVVRNETELCKRDGACYLLIECGAKKHAFIYSPGKESCQQAFYDALAKLGPVSKIKPGPLVEGEGTTVVYSKRLSDIYCTKMNILTEK